MPFRFRQRPRPCVLFRNARIFTLEPVAIVSICSISPTISNVTSAILGQPFDLGKSG